MTINKWLSDAEKALSAAGIGSSRLDAELILAHAINKPRAWIKAHSSDELTASQSGEAGPLLQRRVQREPLVHLTGRREFYGLDFEITPDVLTPRTETEQMVEWAIKHAPENSRLVDIGTGSGAIAIAIKKHRPDLEITATDLSERELVVARRNAMRLGAEVRLVASDLWSALPQEAFATVVTNLPYLAESADLMPEVKREPAVALFGGPDGLDLYRRFLADLPAHLTPGGLLFTESDPWQHEALIAEAGCHGLAPIEQGYFILGFQKE
jgi:release factor glutamine methyltransferase